MLPMPPGHLAAANPARPRRPNPDRAKELVEIGDRSFRGGNIHRAEERYFLATKADPTRPSPEDVADAWINQRDGRESYFFENVRCGIRTPEDGLIWRRMEEQRPSWLEEGAYKSAVDILRRENQSEV